ncbi:unnamed protein product, partial [Scytosiphon promiscuus]
HLRAIETYGTNLALSISTTLSTLCRLSRFCFLSSVRMSGYEGEFFTGEPSSAMREAPTGLQRARESSLVMPLDLWRVRNMNTRLGGGQDGTSGCTLRASRRTEAGWEVGFGAR